MQTQGTTMMQQARAMAGRLSHGVEAKLYKRGFTQPAVRRLITWQVLVTLAVLPAGVLFFWLGLWPLAFVAGSLLATFNFYFLAKSLQQIVFVKYDRQLLVSVLLRFYGRLGITAVALFLLIVWCRVPVVALVAGLSTVVATIVVWGGARLFEQNAKEA
ncbi:ATP synthase subunit I [Oceanidesulfovibrio marinus]|nr:ATP synthase subunit I [Oceanidesulfovibrio marinus]